MKRTPLRRKTPLKSKSQQKRAAMKSAIDTFEQIIHSDPRIRFAVEQRVKTVTRKPRKTTKHARRERAPESWFLWVKSQPCFVCWLYALRPMFPGDWPKLRPTPCCSVIDADHMGDRFKEGDGTRARDSTCVSMCHDHHMERTWFTGAFKDFTKQDMQAFTATGVQWMQNRARQFGVPIPDC